MKHGESKAVPAATSRLDALGGKEGEEGESVCVAHCNFGGHVQLVPLRFLARTHFRTPPFQSVESPVPWWLCGWRCTALQEHDVRLKI